MKPLLMHRRGNCIFGRLYFSWYAVAIIFLIIAGVAYRIVSVRLGVAGHAKVLLPVPLINIPRDIGDWTGEDVPVPPNIQRVAGNDDFINRRYFNKVNNIVANLYIAFTARPRTMLGHRPQVCYPAGGWIHDDTRLDQVVMFSTPDIPCLIHRFHIPSPNYGENVVLNFYIVNGEITADESVFSGVGWRTPNISGNAARYVAQVQISSVLESSVKALARDVTAAILDFLPDKTGHVRASNAAGKNIINEKVNDSSHNER